MLTGTSHRSLLEGPALPSVLRTSYRLDPMISPSRNLQRLSATSSVNHSMVRKIDPPSLRDEEGPLQESAVVAPPVADEEAPVPVHSAADDGPASQSKSSPYSDAVHHQSSSSPPPPLAPRPKCLRTFQGAYGEYFQVPTNLRTPRSFPATQRFQQALWHAKSGPELKAHTVF